MTRAALSQIMEPIEEVQFVWTCILLPASVILNLTAFLWLLKTSGSCFKDPIVPPLLSVIGMIYDGFIMIILNLF